MVHTAPVRTGLEVLLEDGLNVVEGARIGLLTVPAAVDRRVHSAIDRLHEAPGVNLVTLFGPEHGVRGEAQAGEHVPDAVDSETGLPVYSLYGSRREPTAPMLANLDMLLIDLFDVGCRYWTYPYAMAYAMRGAAVAGVKVLVLDRPNPITGTRTEGNLPDHIRARKINDRPVQIPIRHGLTLGELALWFNRDLQLGADLTVIPCEGWQRDMWYDQTGLPFVLPSPNAPTLDTLTLYPGTCLIEGTHVSEGRGTTRPFEWIGAPWIDARRLSDALNERMLPGVRFRPVHFVPTFSKHKGRTCHGVHVHITDRAALDPIRTGVHVLHALKHLDPSRFTWRMPFREGGTYPIDHLSGSSAVRIGLDEGGYPDDIMAGWSQHAARFSAMCGPDVKLYPHPSTA